MPLYRPFVLLPPWDTADKLPAGLWVEPEPQVPIPILPPSSAKKEQGEQTGTFLMDTLLLSVNSEFHS